jgi:hypothetical protein
LIALIDAGQPDHDRCRNALQRPELPLVTTWPAFTDGIHLLGQLVQPRRRADELHAVGPRAAPAFEA